MDYSFQTRYIDQYKLDPHSKLIAEDETTSTQIQ